MERRLQSASFCGLHLPCRLAPSCPVPSGPACPACRGRQAAGRTVQGTGLAARTVAGGAREVRVPEICQIGIKWNKVFGLYFVWN